MDNPYDTLYKQFNMINQPFGYSLEYFLWRTSKLKKELAKFIKKKGLILDVGGGFGIMVKFLPNFIDVKNNYINLDVSREMLKYSSYQNILACAEAIPFRDSTFDYVIMSEVLEHVHDKVLSLKECYRTLKSDGFLLLTTPRTGWIEDFKKSPFSLFLLMEQIIMLMRKTKNHSCVPGGIIDKPSDEYWLKQALRKIGFIVLKQFRADNHVPWCKAGESRLWRWFADRFVNPRKFGHCTVVICTKARSN